MAEHEPTQSDAKYSSYFWKQMFVFVFIAVFLYVVVFCVSLFYTDMDLGVQNKVT